MVPTDDNVVPSFSRGFCVTLWVKLDFGEHMVWVLITAWPIDTEQQLNAFQLLVEFRMAVEIKEKSRMVVSLQAIICFIDEHLMFDK